MFHCYIRLEISRIYWLSDSDRIGSIRQQLHSATPLGLEKRIVPRLGVFDHGSTPGCLRTKFSAVIRDHKLMSVPVILEGFGYCTFATSACASSISSGSAARQSKDRTEGFLNSPGSIAILSSGKSDSHRIYSSPSCITVGHVLEITDPFNRNETEIMASTTK
jgi:hypothetical protein